MWTWHPGKAERLNSKLNQLIQEEEPPTYLLHSFHFITTFNMEKENLLPTHNDKSSQAMETDQDIIILMQSHARRQLSLAIAFTVVAFLYLCFSISRLFVHETDVMIQYEAPTALVLDESAYSSKSLVPLEAHIMSKCPDAKVRHFPTLIPACQLIPVGMFEGVGAPNDATSERQSQLYTVIYRDVRARTSSTEARPRSLTPP